MPLYILKLQAQTSGHGNFQIFAPNTYELGRYGDVPVDLSSGIPQINLPILNFSDKDVNLDISLSYHASGIKVDQEATWVGLGWALNAGGVITREVRGLPDGYSGYNNAFVHRTVLTDFDGSSPANYYDLMRSDLNIAVSTNGTDNGADIFFYNFNGRAGKFFLDGDANAVLTKYEDFQVAFLRGSASGSNTNDYFVITDEKGVKYEFKEMEFSGALSGGIPYISAWYLSKITGPSGGEITIEYTTGGITSRLYQQRCYSQAYFAINSVTHSLPQIYTEPCVSMHYGISSIIPKKIKDPLGNYVEFITSSIPRRDSEGYIANQLDYLILYSNKQEQIKKFKFNYSYFEANNRHKFPVYGTGDPRSFLNFRLRLDSFQEISAEGQMDNAYRFEYFGDNNPETDDIYNLPYRLSPSQDHWGYYNGSLNSTIFPGNPADKPFHRDEWNLALGEYEGHPSLTYAVTNGGRREPDAEAVKACALNKIIYPTGGYTGFVFEPHESDGSGTPLSGGLKVRQIEKGDGISAPKITNYEYDNYRGSGGRCLFLDNSYYTWYWHKYAPDLGMYGNPEILMSFGVPEALAKSNESILKADGTPQLLLGSGANAYYLSVKESSPGNGWTIYDFSYDEDFMDGNREEIDGISTPGYFYSAFIDTYGRGGYPPFVRSMSGATCVFPFPYFLNNDWRRGHLQTKRTYSQENVLLAEDSIYYEIRALKAVPGYKIAQVDEGRFFYARYYDIGGMVKPVRQVSSVYNNDGSITRTTKNLYYNAVEHKQLTESRDYSSKDEEVRTRYYYPPEYGNTFSLLKGQHILSPIDVRSYKNGKLITGEQIQYNEKGLPQITYKAEAGGLDIAFNAQSPFTFTQKVSNVYNSDNTLRSQTLKDGTPIVYLWSYKGRYPVAQIQNALYEDVKAALNDGSESLITNLRNKSEPSADDLVVLSALRDNSLLKGAKVTIYTFKPLVGMTSQTDERGRTLSYEYDTFQRLKIIRNDNGDILENYQYHFKP
ncbi:hypothetical protein [Pararcticibacter amylolyticus]|uniref:Sugar-binding protein n=1 Tax=Pararcticibacter amylolyticus TaxID=2173175 RepID=A0A2U2P9A9_9SPHI|nr:hypothetical protein [Pararcticibacter amylolyticus]PWG77963.1 hypothetical protein DDR33_24730 [Pararcticibacter amylolyticus]